MIDPLFPFYVAKLFACCSLIGYYGVLIDSPMVGNWYNQVGVCLPCRCVYSVVCHVGVYEVDNVT